MKHKTYSFFPFKISPENGNQAGIKTNLPSKNPSIPLRFYLYRGMTLIEIMIVVGIIAFLVGAVGKGVMDRFQKSKVPQAKIVISLLEQSLAEFNMDCGYYPQTLNDLISATADCEEWDGPYVKNGKIPKDPWKNDLIYEIDETGDYNIISFGADKKPQGKGLNRDISSND